MDKKILIIVNNLGIGGAERLVVDDVKEMLRIGVDVVLVTLSQEPPRSFARELGLGNDKTCGIYFKSFFDVVAWFRLTCFIRDFKPDLIITQLWFANTIGRIAGLFANAKSIISFEQNVYDTVKTKKMFFADWYLQFFTTKIIAVSEAVKKSLIRHHISESKIEVLHNCVDLKKFSSAPDRFVIRKEFNLPEKSFVYVFVGRLIHQKAVDVLIEAFKMVDLETYLLIVGQGNNQESLMSQVSRNRLENRVLFAGVRTDVSKILASSDCFVLPSRHEGLPLILIEALASGVPVIVSDFEAAQEVITHEKNGLVVPRENISALAEAMIRVKNDPGLRAKLSLEAKKTAVHFSISNHVRAILRFVKTQ